MNNYQLYYNHIVGDGAIRQVPRGLATTGKVDQKFYFNPGEVYTRPGGNPNIGFIELLQFMSGSFNIGTFKKVTPNARLDLFTRQSAYGPRTVDQLGRVLKELRSDGDSRRAVLMVASEFDTSKTLPCTLTIQFQIVEGKLWTIVNMRSSDLIWGLPTDMIQFGGISMMFANLLDVEVGLCSVNAGNAHVYDATRDGKLFELRGKFSIPKYKTLGAYSRWAMAMDIALEDGLKTVKDIFPLKKEGE